MVELKINGELWGYWQRVSLRESVDDLCASVNLSISLQPDAAGISPKLDQNTLVQVLVDGELATTVRAGKVRRHVDSNNHSISFEARSLARELVDCQYSKTLSGLSLADVVKRICETFKVPVKIAAKTAVVPDFSMQCEMPANALINAARTANQLLYPTPDGGLILTTPDDTAPVATLTYGESILSYDVLDDYDQRFSEYVVKSFDHDSGAAPKGVAKDKDFNFFRPMHIVGDRYGNSLGSCSRRAQLERGRRLARAHAIRLQVDGWRHDKGIWAVNKQVRVVIPPEGIDDVFLIGDRAFDLDDKSGSVTSLTVMHRNAFAGEPPRKKTKRSTGVRR
ncbi:MAG: phage tail protein [Sideroxydans sp.]|nr:phage tail protein [Sideroxydans sp.]